MLDFTSKIQELKLKNDDLVNFRLNFGGERLYLEGEFIEDGINNGFYDAGTIAYFYIPTSKGYISSEWKKSIFYKGINNINQKNINDLEPYLQSGSPKVFIRNTGGTTVSHAIMNHINDAGSMLEEYSK